MSLPPSTPAAGASRAMFTRRDAVLAFGALGVVFGDIGTSPLYTLQECIGGAHGVPPEPRNVLGVLSLVLWSLTLVVTIKYLAFLMQADNRGEGGIMALLALAPEELRSPGPGRVGFLSILVITGAALLFGDGMITPAISVLSAMEGLGIATRALEPAVVPSTVVILIALFVLQRQGTGRIGRLFAPVMLVWFAVIAALGVRHIAARPEILSAFSPHHGVRFFAEHGFHGLRLLGGVVLTVTGGEALYADMGHFGRRPIRIAWLAAVYPALLLCYLGQGALLLDDPGAAARPFYAMAPSGGWIYPLVALSAAATVIASQALISGVFSLTHQSIRLGYFPRLTVKHTSGEAEGQIYLPLVNWGLAVACIALVLGFRQSSRLASAFGLAVSGTMLITSIVFYVILRRTWGWSRLRAGALLALFLAVDIPFVVANSLKLLDGGYIPLLLGAGFIAVMVSWRIGRGLLGQIFAGQARPVDAFMAGLDSELVGRIPGTAVFMSSLATGIPPVLFRMVQRFRVAHEKTLLLTVTSEHVPQVPEAERIEVGDLGKGFFRVVARYGFMDEPDAPRVVGEALRRLGLPARPADVVYVLGRETVVPTPRGRMGQLTERMFALLSRNARNATDYFGIPPEQVIELGTQIDL